MARGPHTRDASTLGDKLLPKVVQAVSQAIISTKRGLLPWDHYVRVKSTQDIIDRMGREVAEHWGPIAQQILDIDDGTLNPDVRTFMEDSISGEHQLKAITGLTMGAAQGAISTFISNELAPLVYRIVSLNPSLDLDPATAATAAAQRIVSPADAAQTAANQGFDAGVAEALHQLAYVWPGISDAIDMRRRKFIDDAEFTTILERNAVPDGLFNAYRAEQGNILSLADAALAYLRSDITLAEAQNIAADNGYSNAQLDIFIGNTGEPLAEEQLAEAFRREFIDQARFERGIKQSRIRNEWIDVALALRFSPMSVADAVNAAVQNHITQADAQKIAVQNGLEAAAFPVLYETAGEPLSRTELEELFNRGLASQAEVEQGLRESRLKDKYVAQAFELHTRLLEPRTLSSAVEMGSISHADAVKAAMEYGYSAANAEVIVNEGSNRKLKTYRERVVSAAEGLYEENAISQDQFLAIAKSMGFDANEADFIYESAEYRRQSKAVTSVISAIRAKYIAHHITKNEAGNLLDALGIVSGRRDYLLSLWEIESAANVKTLTTAQVVKAVKNALITPEDGLARLKTDGYNETDAELLLEGA